MPDTTPSIISKVWGMCNPLRDDGVSYQDYLEQLTYMIFLKMSDEYSRPPYNRETGIPAGCGWADMNGLTGAALEEKYKEILDTRRPASWAKSSCRPPTRSATPPYSIAWCR